jgi:hypothetical protein
MVFIMEIMVLGCSIGVVKTIVQFNEQSALLDNPPPQLVH